jgi:hypothetical protein
LGFGEKYIFSFRWGKAPNPTAFRRLALARLYTHRTSRTKVRWVYIIIDLYLPFVYILRRIALHLGLSVIMNPTFVPPHYIKRRWQRDAITVVLFALTMGILIFSLGQHDATPEKTVPKVTKPEAAAVADSSIPPQENAPTALLPAPVLLPDTSKPIPPVAPVATPVADSAPAVPQSVISAPPREVLPQAPQLVAPPPVPFEPLRPEKNYVAPAPVVVSLAPSPKTDHEVATAVEAPAIFVSRRQFIEPKSRPVAQAKPVQKKIIASSSAQIARLSPHHPLHTHPQRRHHPLATRKPSHALPSKTTQSATHTERLSPPSASDGLSPDTQRHLLTIINGDH